MKKWILFAGVFALCAGASAQASETKRLDAVWSAVNDRLTRQADAWFKVGDYPRIVQLLRIHYGLDLSNYDIGTNLGFMLENVEQYDKALAVYIQLRTANPTEPDDAWPEANFYFAKKAYAKIPPILEPTIKDHDPHANNYRTLANAYEKMSMFSDSKRVWEQYLGKHPQDLAGKAHYERILKKLKEGFSKKT